MDIPLSYPEPDNYYEKRDKGECLHMIFIDNYWYNLAWSDKGEFLVLRAKQSEYEYQDSQPWDLI